MTKTTTSNWDEDDEELDSIIDRPLPSSDDAEKLLIAAPLLDQRVMETIAKQIGPDDFYSPALRRVFVAMLDLFTSDKTIDAINITESMKSIGQDVASIGGVSFIMSLLHGLPHYDAKSIQEHIDTVKKHSVSRRALTLSNKLIKDLWSGTEDVAEVLETFESKIGSLNVEIQTSSTQTNIKGFYTMEEIVPELRERLVNFHKGISSGVKTGFWELDELLDGGGLQAGAVYLFAATEKTGKTSLILDIAYNIAAIFKESAVPFVTMEMNKTTLAQRLFSSHTGIPYNKFRPGFRDDSHAYYSTAMESLEDFSKIPIWIADSLYSFNQIARYLRKAVELGHKTGRLIKVACIDYLQLIGWDEKTSGETEAVTKISRAVKMLANELGIAIIIISNLNRQGLSEGQEPDTFNLRNSGTLAFDAEAVLFLHNPAYIPGKPYERRDVTDINLILSRQRNGPTDRIPLKFIGKFMQFMDLRTYGKLFGDGSQEQTIGQAAQAQEQIEDMWEIDDEE